MFSSKHSVMLFFFLFVLLTLIFCLSSFRFSGGDGYRSNAPGNSEKDISRIASYVQDGRLSIDNETAGDFGNIRIKNEKDAEDLINSINRSNNSSDYTYKCERYESDITEIKYGLTQLCSTFGDTF